MKVRIRDIRLGHLDSHTISQIAKFVHIARSQGDKSLRLKNPEVVKQVFVSGLKTDHVAMRMLFLEIRRSLRQHLASCSKNMPLKSKGGTLKSTSGALFS